jgi:uncharacterized membrane protein
MKPFNLYKRVVYVTSKHTLADAISNMPKPRFDKCACVGSAAGSYAGAKVGGMVAGPYGAAAGAIGGAVAGEYARYACAKYK